MSLSFLVPAFLLGLAALAIPIIIHLTRRQTKESVDFPSLMFVGRIPHKSTQRRQIRNWPLLLMRILAILLITLAFARPYLQREETSALPAMTGSRETVILLDRSYSMAYGDRWAEAKAAAAERIDGMGGNDRVSLILFDSRSEAVVESSPDEAMLRAALNAAEPSARATRFTPAFRFAERLLTASQHPRREVVIISDFQRNGWEKDAGEAQSIRFPAGTVVTPVSIGDPSPSNVLVGSVSFTRTLAAGRERAVATARLQNQGATAHPALPVTLEIDGRRVETRTVSLEAGGAATVEFAPVTLAQTGITRGVVRTPADSLPADNAYHFALSPDQRIGVVIVDGASGGQGSFFLERALAIGDAPGFRTVVRREGALQANDLTQASVLVLNQAGIPGGELGNRVRTFVQNGGGLLLLLGDNRTGGWEGVVPDRPGGTADHRDDGGIALGFVDFGHPAFAAFSTPRSGDFTAARFYRYRELPTSPEQRVLARFSDGATALAEQPVGKGRVLVWTSSLDTQATDLALQPVFLPFVHELVKHASGYATARPAFTVGDPFDPAVAALASQQFGLALSPSGERIQLDEEGSTLTLDEPGFYELRDARSGARASAVAVNLDPAESQLETVPAAEVVAAITPSADAASRAGGPLSLTLEDREREQSAWWYLVVVGFLLLAAETVLSNWRRKTQTV